MSLRYEYLADGGEVLAFGPNESDMICPKPCFVISGDQKDVHKYLELVSKTKDIRFQVFYEVRTESRTTALGFIDADVNATFCFSPIKDLDEVKFKKIFITPFIHLFQ